jgi:predicted membrane protein
METQPLNTDQKNESNNNGWKKYEEAHKRGKVFGGVLVVIIGSLFLARALGADFPRWLFSWKTLLIGIGLAIGFKHNFRTIGWIFPVIIGTVFLFIDWVPELNIRHYVWPIVIILGGLFMIFKPSNWNRQKHWNRYQRRYGKAGSYNYNASFSSDNTSFTSSEDTIESSTFMAGIKKNIITKNFKGGNISNAFGGTEINLSQADIQDKAVLKISQIFGGTTLIIPANWEIHSELESIFGSIEDQRPIYNNSMVEPRKVLVLKGSTFMGGIEIKSY